MKDKLDFKKTILPNGMAVYSQYNSSVEFALMSLVVPVGHMHNSGEVIDGSFHFLEHLVMNSSKLNPKKALTMDMIDSLGGSFSAYTKIDLTEYSLNIPTKHLEKSFDAMLSHFCEPVFTDSDIRYESNIIANERDQQAYYYPGQNSASKYLILNWMNGGFFPIEQKFGSDDDHKRMSADYLYGLHNQYYFSNKNYFVIVGNFDLQMIFNKLSKIKTIENVVFPVEKYNQLAWNIKTPKTSARIQTLSLPGHSGFLYAYKSIYQIENMSPFERRTIPNFIKEMLSDYSDGTILSWLRREKSWTYGVDMGIRHLINTIEMSIEISVNSEWQTEIIRSELQKRILDILGDEKLLKMIKDRKRNRSVFWYEELIDRISDAKNDIFDFGYIESCREYFDSINSITCDILQKTFIEKIQPNSRDIVIVPKSE